MLREALAIREAKMPNDWLTPNAKWLLGGALLGQKKYAEAEPLLLKGYEGMKQREKTIPPQGSIRIPEALDRVLHTCALTEVTGRLLGHLSKGYRQRVGLAQALIHDPPVLILDEPTIGLDPRQIMDIQDLIKSFGAKRTVVLSTHILAQVLEVCEKVVIINEGRIVLEGLLEQLTRTRKLDEVYLQAISTSTPEVEVLQADT